jgi:protein PET100, fungi type
MYYFGTNLEDRFSVPGYWPTTEQSHKIPLEKEEIDRELARMRMADAIRRESRDRRREREVEEATSIPTPGEGGRG